MGSARLSELGERLGAALAAVDAKARGLVLGRDLAVVVSADAVHYGADFRHVPFGDGGVDAYAKATARDARLLIGPSAGRSSAAKAAGFPRDCVEPREPADYRLTWCGRFSIPLGLCCSPASAADLGRAGSTARPLAYATSVGPARAAGARRPASARPPRPTSTTSSATPRWRSSDPHRIENQDLTPSEPKASTRSVK